MGFDPSLRTSAGPRNRLQKQQRRDSECASRRMSSILQLLPSVVLLATAIPPTSLLYLPARTAVRGHVVCEQPEPYRYCAFRDEGVFAVTLTPDNFETMCRATPRTQSLRAPYIVRAAVRWLPWAVGREACFVARFLRDRRPGERSTGQADLRPASVQMRTCHRSTNDHVMLSWLDEVAVENSSKLYLSIGQSPSHNPVEVLGVFLQVRAIYE
jgi:hypothetical protein